MWKDSRRHRLTLSYDTYSKMNKSIQNCVIDKYIVYQSLGSGAFGEVYRGMNDQTKATVAIKVLDLEKVRSEKNGYKREILKRLCRTESALMMKCNSEHVVACYDVYQNLSLKIMVIEYCNGGTLQAEIDYKQVIPEKEAILILKQIINGIGEMHEKRILHRDLKAENILSHNGVYKVADLGFSKQVQSEGEMQHTTLGTVTTMAPEVLDHKQYGLKADIWSVGVIFYQMVFGVYPFPKTNSHPQAFKAIQKFSMGNGPTYTDNKHTASREVTQFLREVLTIDSEKRLGWKEVLNHPIFKEEKAFLNNQFRLSLEIVVPQETVQIDISYEQTQENMTELDVAQLELTEPNSAPVEVTPLMTGEVMMKKKELNAEEDQVFKWVRLTHHECLKTQLIFYEIISQIEKHQMLNLKSRESVEFMYLVLTRCRNNISAIHNELGRVKNKQQFAIKNLELAVNPLYFEIDDRWKRYVSILTEIESKILNVIGDKIAKVFAQESQRQKDQMLGGIEAADYSRQEQVNYTDKNYIPGVMGQIAKIKSKQAEKVNNYLRHYSQINAIKQSQLGKRTFREYVQMIIQ